MIAFTILGYITALLLSFWVGYVLAYVVDPKNFFVQLLRVYRSIMRVDDETKSIAAMLTAWKMERA